MTALVDLRSDTVTRPTAAMRQAIAGAEVGDDVFRDDPTVLALERETAAILGKEAALFVPSGTMANQLAVAVLTSPGTELLLEEGAHILNYEGGAPAALWGVQIRPLPGEHGRLTPEQVRGALKPANEHFAPPAALALENTHNRAGGAVWPLRELNEVFATARDAGLRTHLDGARLWNAAVAAACDPASMAAGADTVSVCFSKGLGAPVGSCLAGSAADIGRARFVRKRLGGGMRQVGIIAAGALHALHHHRERLVEDHVRAARLAEVLTGLPGLEVLPVQTNIVIVDMKAAGRRQGEVVEAMREEGILIIGFGDTRIRMVTHLDVDDAGIERASAALRRVFGGQR